MPSYFVERGSSASVLRWAVCLALVLGASCQVQGGDVTKLAAQDANFANWLRNSTRGVVLDPTDSPDNFNVIMSTSLDATIENWTCTTTDRTFQFDKAAAKACQQKLLDTSCLTCRVILGITVNLESDFRFIPDDFLARAQKLPCLQKLEVKGSLAAGILASEMLPETTGVSTMCFDVRDTMFDPASVCKDSKFISLRPCPSNVTIALPLDAQSISIRGQPKATRWFKTVKTFKFPRIPQNIVNLHIEGTAFGSQLPSISHVIETIEMANNQFSGSIPISWAKALRLTDLELWEPGMGSSLDIYIDMLERFPTLEALKMCFDTFNKGGERAAQRRIMSRSSRRSVSRMCGLDLNAARKDIQLCSLALDRVAYCSPPEERDFTRWAEDVGIYDKMSFTLHDDPGIKDKTNLCSTIPKDAKLWYNKGAINQCSKTMTDECPNCSRVAGISLNLSGELVEGIDVRKFMKETAKLPCLQKLEVKGDFAQGLLSSPFLKTTTHPPALCFDVRGTRLDASAGCKSKLSCMDASKIKLPGTTQILSIRGTPSSRPWSKLSKNATLFALPNSIEHLHIEGTVFGGALPDKLPSELEALDLAGNQFSGLLPQNWTRSENLMELRLWEPGMENDIQAHVDVFDSLPGLKKIGFCLSDEKELNSGVESLDPDWVPVLCDFDRDVVQICSVEFERISTCAGSEENEFMEWAMKNKIFDKLELTLDGDDAVQSTTQQQCATFPHQTNAFYDKASQNECKRRQNQDCPGCKRAVGVTFDATDLTSRNLDVEEFLTEVSKLPCLQKLEVSGAFGRDVLNSPGLQDLVALDTLCLDLGEPLTDKPIHTLCNSFDTGPSFCSDLLSVALPDSLRKLSIREVSPNKSWKKAAGKSILPLFALPTALQQLHLEGTNFGGALPSDLPAELTHAVFTKNQFSGGMPSGWGQTERLTQLHVWEPAMENELESSAKVLTPLLRIQGIGLCFNKAKLSNGDAISDSQSDVEAICSLTLRLDPKDFRICSALFDRVLHCSGPEEARFWRYSHNAGIYSHLSLVTHDESRVRRKWMPCSTFPSTFRVRYDRDRLDECQADTLDFCPWCSRIVGIDFTGEVGAGEDVDEAEFVEEIGKLPCLQKLELRGEFGRRVLMTPAAKQLANVLVICMDAGGTILDHPASTTVAPATIDGTQDVFLPRHIHTLSIKGSQPLHEWSKANASFPLFPLPRSLQALHLEGTAYGGPLPQRLPRNLTNLVFTKNQFVGLLPSGVLDALESANMNLNIWEPGMDNRLPATFARARWGALDIRRPSLSLCFQSAMENGTRNLIENSPKAAVAVLCDTDLRPKVCSSTIDILRDCRKVFSDAGADFLTHLQEDIDKGHLGGVSVGSISRSDEAVFTDVCQRGRCFRSFHSTNYTGEELSHCEVVFDFDKSYCPRCKRIINVKIEEVAGSYQTEEITQLLGALPCLFQLTLTQNSTDGLMSSLSTLQNIHTLRVQGSNGVAAKDAVFPELPSELRRLIVMDTSYGGSLPQALPSGLRTLQIEKNLFSGPLPSTIPRGVREVHILDNQFTGTVPQGWCRASRLRELSISETRMRPAALPQCLELINLRFLNVCFKDSERRLPEKLRLELCSVGGQYCWRTLRDCLDDYALEILLGVWIPFVFFAVVILPLMPVALNKFMGKREQKEGTSTSWWIEWANVLISNWLFRWFTKGVLLVLLYLWDIGSDLYVIWFLWGRVAAYIMMAVVAMHFVMAFVFFGRKVRKAGLKTRQIDASIKVPDKLFDWVFLIWAHQGHSVIRGLKVVLITIPGTIAFDIFGIVSRLTGSRLECISSKFDFYAHFESRALTESIVEAPLEAVFQSIVFGIGTNDTLRFGLSRRAFLLSILAGMFSMTKALVLLRYRSWEYDVSFWVILYKEATGTMDTLDDGDGDATKDVADGGSESSQSRMVGYAYSCEMGALTTHSEPFNVAALDKWKSI